MGISFFVKWLIRHPFKFTHLKFTAEYELRIAIIFKFRCECELEWESPRFLDQLLISGENMYINTFSYSF